jgi:hypothetical protein
MISDLTTANDGHHEGRHDQRRRLARHVIATTYTDAKLKTSPGRRTESPSAAPRPTRPSTCRRATPDRRRLRRSARLRPASGTARSIGLAYTDAKLTSLTGTANRITIDGTATAPIVDIAASLSRSDVDRRRSAPSRRASGTRPASARRTPTPRSCRSRARGANRHRRHGRRADRRH